jgi:hypothetical protein
MKKLLLVVFLCTGLLLMGTTASALPTYLGSDPPASLTEFVTPGTYEGNPSLTDFGYTDVFKIEPVSTGSSGTSTGGVTFSIDLVYDNGDGPLFNWSSPGFEIYAVLVKGGPNANLYEYGPGISLDTGLHAPTLASNGKFAGLSHVEFAGAPVPEPATLLLLGCGLLGLAGFGRKRFKK